MDKKVYDAPAVADLGTLAAMTQATGFVDAEDGANKLMIHHSAPSNP